MTVTKTLAYLNTAVKRFIGLVLVVKVKNGFLFLHDKTNKRVFACAKPFWPCLRFAGKAHLVAPH
jgi:hypothetical protein